jgi:predicted GH43/DUF377 family glycosyl hydrolase
MKELFERCKDNPIIIADHMPYPVNSVFNPAAARIGDKYFLFLRIEDRSGLSHFVGAYSWNGITDWEIDESTKFIAPGASWGVEDPRIVYLSAYHCWAITYTHYSPVGAAVGLSFTESFYSYIHFGIILPPSNKDAVLFPELIDDRWHILHRPYGPRKDIWISYSPAVGESYPINNLRYWGDHKPLMVADGSPRWDGQHLGVNTPPLKTEYGWLVCYHGVKRYGNSLVYRLGLALLDLNNPAFVTHRTREPVMTPQFPYEKRGDVDKVIFPCGWVVDDDGFLRLYYGAADSCVATARAPLEDVLTRVLKDPVG